MEEQHGSAMEAAAPEMPSEAPKEPSRAARFFRRALRWAAFILAMFTIGFLVTWYAQVVPKARQIESLTQQQAAAEERIQALETELESLKTVRQENEQLREQLDQAGARLELLSILVDVTRSQLGVAQEDPVHALAALDGTAEKLASLRSQLTGSDAEAVGGMADRLQLVVSEVNSDIFAAQRDLEILANTLVELDQELFAGG
jgi:chromosome segregation ATPase